MNSSDAQPMDIQPVMPEPQYVGASPPPRWYDPRFSKAVTILSAIVLSASVTLVVWFAVDIPKLGRVADAEKALEHMVSRIMDVEEGFRRLPAWEHFFYEVTMGSDTSERDQAIAWYEELVEVSADPRVDLNLAILLAESGRVQEVTKKITEWTGREDPFPLFAHILQAGYFDDHVPRQSEGELQAQLAELLPAGWFYDRLALRLAEKAGDSSLLATVRSSADSRADAIVRRSRIFASIEIAFMIFGGTILLYWFRRRGERQLFLVGPAELPPIWAGKLGAAVLLRGGAIGAVLTLGFLFAALDFASLRVLVVPLSNVPLLFLAYVHLLKPQGLTFGEGFGLSLERDKVGNLVFAVSAVVAAGLLGEWVMGKIAEPLNLSSHWTEWFDADLVWAPLPVMAVSLVEYVLFAPVFEELAFRGLLFGVLRRRFQWGPAAVLSAAIFAVAHGYGLIGFISVFWSGVIWAWVYERTGSLLPGMIGHAINNLLVCLSVIALLRS